MDFNIVNQLSNNQTIQLERLLYCRPEMVPFYHKWGFSEKLGDLTFMRLINS
ncbi:hypothetical protein PH210_09630 [Paenibacillus sp. BSR1-1]|uniref:hypothetical protein n=1 Tax=Paenibacillus sp. BSR1-1 TaxID=3020845 RepID=UPI0025B1B685|nr:hypothetical protein [Paenibacillus sp. BSR1-1]MDN3016462.1 hypothetical protein [Paenibacillus sp. BSR1-1]